MPSPTDLRISKIRTRLLFDKPWWGNLALKMTIRESKNVPTMGNNGTVLQYNKEYVDKLSDRELLGLMAHEVCHCVFGHMFRGKGRHWHTWNVAGDLIINPILRREGFTLPHTELEPEEKKYIGMFAEQVYSILMDERDKKPKIKVPGMPGGMPGSGDDDGDDDDGDGDGDDDCECGLQPAPEGDKITDEDGNEIAVLGKDDWAIAVEQATIIAKKAGKMPADLERLLETQKKSNTDWRNILKRFVQNSMPSDYSWLHPSRRHIADGLYLPGIIKEGIPRIGVAIDTSGSISKKTLEVFAAELTNILHETMPESIDVVYCDAAVQGRQKFDMSDYEIKLEAKGGGGTEFQPAIDVFNQDPPACLIYLTDLYGPRPEEPAYPVMWAVEEQNNHDSVWFGELIKISHYD